MCLTIWGWHEQNEETVALLQNSEWRFLSKLLDDRSQMVLSLLKFNMLVQMFTNWQQ